MTNSMKPRILIVEDDPHILLGLEEVMKGDGFDVTVCNRGDKAVETVSKCHPSLIVLDVMLPGASGYDICKQLRAKKNTTPILMLTAKGQEIDKVVGLDLGADDYVTKPFGVRELLARIHALLRRADQITANAGAAARRRPDCGVVHLTSGELRGRRHLEQAQRAQSGDYLQSAELRAAVGGAVGDAPGVHGPPHRLD